MSESNVTIKIDIDAKTGAIERVRAELAALAAQAELAEKRFRDIADSSNKLNKDFVSLDKEVRRKEKDFDNMSGAIDRNEKSMKKNRKEVEKSGKGMKTFAGILKKVISFLVKGFLISFAASAASLIALNLALKAGSAIAKGYAKTMSGVFQVISVAGATAVTVLAALAAGQREYAAAVSSAKYRDAQRGGLYEATTQMRALTSNTQLAVLGSEALQAAFAGMNKHAKVTGGMVTSMQAMGDFIATAGDPKKAAAAAGEFLGLLAKEGKLSSNVVKAAAAVGPEFEKAVKEASKKGMSSSGAFLKALVGGELSTEVAGQLDTINNTLFGTAKRYFQIIKGDFADFGQPLLGPFTKTLDTLGKIVRRTFMGISGAVNVFAGGTFTDSLVSMADKFGYWVTKTFNEYLPKASGMFDRIRKFWDDVKYGFSQFADWMRPLTEGGQVLIDMLGPVFKSIFGGFNQGLSDLTNLLVDNKDTVVDFGQTVGRLFESVGKIFGQLKETTIKVMPFLSAIGDVLATIASVLAQVMSIFNSIPGGFGSLAMVIGGGYGYYKLGKMGQSKTGSKGTGIIDTVKRAAGIGGTSAQTVTMSAGVVYLNGPVTSTVAAKTTAAVSSMATSKSGTKGVGSHVTDLGGKHYLGGSSAGLMSMLLMPVIGSYLESSGLSGAGAAATIAGLGMLTGGFGLAGGATLALPYGMGASIPAMGAATPIAAAAGGYLGGSVASSAVLGTKWAQSYGTTGQKVVGVGSGILGGAATGASIGGTIGALGLGPLGAGAGAVVGGIIGGITGGISGWINAGKNERAAKQIAKDFTGDYNDAIQEALGRGDIKAAQKLEQEMLGMRDSLAASTPDAEAFNKEFSTTADQIKGMNERGLREYNKNLKIISKATGRSTDEIAKLADEMGVNLVGKLEDVGAAISQITGMQQFKTGKQVESYGLTTLAGIVTDALGKPIREKEAAYAIDQAGIALRQSIDEGLMPDKAQIAEYLQNAFQYELSMGKTADEALAAINAQLGVGGRMYSKGFRFEGLGDTLGPQIQQLLGSIFTEFASPTAGGLVDQLLTNLATTVPNFDRAGTMEALNSILNDPTKNFAQKLDSISQLLDASTLAANYTEAGTAIGLFKNEVLRITGELGVIKFTTTPFVTTTPGGFAGPSGPNGSYTPTPSWPPTGLGPAGPSAGTDDDTSTPKSNLFNSMKIHSALSRSTFGKQQITSGIRNFNIGSINSDHTTGRALDLTGQNLGMYATAMRGIGGFAEFHGRGGNRHLHVVPPDATGDTAAPIPSMSPVSTASSTSNQYSIVINPSQNASAQEIAEAVMQRIYREQRSARERQ